MAILLMHNIFGLLKFFDSVATTSAFITKAVRPHLKFMATFYSGQKIFFIENNKLYFTHLAPVT